MLCMLGEHPLLCLWGVWWWLGTWNSWSPPGSGIQQSISERGRWWDSCSVPIARDQLTVAKPQYGSNIVIRSCLLHR